MQSHQIPPADPGRPAPAGASERDQSLWGWVGIAANRNSGIGRGLRSVHRLVAALRRVGLGAEIAWTPEARAALVSHSAADPRCRCLIAVGGDGTVSALINEGPSVPLTVLPAGTENLVAQHFSLGRDPKVLAGLIAAGRPVRVDLGRAAERRFLLMVGFGFDADIVTRHHQARVSRLGLIRPTSRLAYVRPILQSSLSYRFPRISVRIADPGTQEVMTGTTVFIFNMPRYALGLPFAPTAREDDGWLDLVVFRDPGPLQALYYLWKVFRGTHLDQPGVFHRRVKKLVVTADEPIPVQIDGDPGGYVLPADLAPRESPIDAAGESQPGDSGGIGHAADSAAGWTVEVLPAALDVIAPTDCRTRPTRVPLASEGLAR
ncbi:MAG: diacylglycerol/lipid kinase family protein [Isosphaerales bacterium]